MSLFVDYAIQNMMRSPVTMAISSTAYIFSFLPSDNADLGQMDIDGLVTWIRINNIEQSIRVVEVLLTRARASAATEREIVADIELEIAVVQTVLSHVRDLKDFHRSCWCLGDWRVGSLDAVTSDLVTSLKLIQSKLNLIGLLREARS